MPPEHMELWVRRFGIRERLSDGLSLALGLFFLEDAWMIMLQLPALPNGWFLDGKELQAQPRIGLAWQRVACLFFGCSRGDRL